MRSRLRKLINRECDSDPLRIVRGFGYAFDERFGKTPAPTRKTGG